MNLLSRTVLIVVVIIVLLCSFYLTINYNATNTHITQAQAKSLIITDLKQHAPLANISILSITNSSTHPGSWSILARTISAKDSACPSVVEQQFDYPATGFLNTTTVYSNYSNGMCMVYGEGGMQNAALNNVIGLPAIAIATPYNLSYAPLVNYINTYKYNNILAHAYFYNQYNITHPIAMGMFNDVWYINYTSPLANSSYIIILNQSGNILTGYTTNSIQNQTSNSIINQTSKIKNLTK